MKGDPDRLREWAAHWADKGHSPDSGLLLVRERWDVGGGDVEGWELRLADLNALIAQADLAASIPADRLNPWHTVTVGPKGWHMAHPVTCSLAECPFDGLAQAEWTEPPAPEGVWRWHAWEDDPSDWERADA